MNTNSNNQAENLAKPVLANRLFKFRAWEKEQNRMFKVFGFNEHLVFEQTWDSPSIKENIFEIEDCHIMQFTGLIDKNGTEIFEGDIVKRVIGYQGNENISFESKLDLYNDMLGNERQIRVLGNGVGYIIAVLAVMNYVNMMIASVQNRKKEFATLESIGMTKKQQVKVLIKEGIIYASLSSVVAFALGIPISYVVFQNMNIYRLSFSVPFFSNAVLLLVVFMICSLIPVLVYKSVCSGTVIERMQSIGE